jgi:hypothetical protein
MKIGIIISMYEEYENTLKNIKIINNNKLPIILIQSEPKDIHKNIDSDQVSYYKMFPDITGTGNLFTGDAAKTISHPLGRNISQGFNIAKSFDIDWWVIILGDVKITNFNGIKKIINKMKSENKTLGITREIGLTFTNKFGKPGKIEKSDTHNFVPTFFIVNAKLVKKGIFQKIEIINPFAMEECMGVTATKFFEKNKMEFFEQCHIIADYAYPKFIEGLEYSEDRTVLPRYVDGVVNAIRRFRTSFSP